MKIALLLSLLYLTFPATAWLQNVSLDPDFGPYGNGYNPQLGSNALFTEMAIRPDKRIVILGFEQMYTDSLYLILTSFTPDGLLDNAFGLGGKVVFGQIPYYDGIIRELLILPDGKLLGAVFVQNDDAAVLLVFKRHENGSIDSSFAENGFLTVEASEDGFSALSLTIDEEENLYLFGSNQHQQAILKLTADGAPDLSFGNNGMAMMPLLNAASIEWGRDIIRMADGKFITTAFVDDSISTKFVTSRWNANGTPDMTFGENASQFISEGESYANFYSIHPQPNGKILYKDYYNFSAEINLIRLEENGMPDLSFGTNGKVKMEDTYGPISNDAILICPDGSFLMPLSVEDSVRHNYLVRYHPDFSIDSTFGDNGKFEFPAEINGLGFCSILFQGNDKLVFTIFCELGSFYYSSLARLNIEGHTSVSIADHEEPEIIIYPNPASEDITIRFFQKEQSLMTFELLDAHGRTIQSFGKNIFADSGENVLTYNLKKQIQPGLYYIRMLSENQQQVYPLMIGR